VITVAGASDQVAGLVYVAAFAPDEGENLVALQERVAPSEAAPHFQPAPFPPDGTEFAIDPAEYARVFAGDVEPGLATFMAHAQRPLSGAAFGEPAPVAAWRSKPTWAILPTSDKTINPELHRFSYDRMGAQLTTVADASHVVMISQPDVVAGVVADAAKALAAEAVPAS
jgi:pimeloyl-ACP methyl ester carboxylesterase